MAATATALIASTTPTAAIANLINRDNAPSSSSVERPLLQPNAPGLSRLASSHWCDVTQVTGDDALELQLGHAASRSRSRLVGAPAGASRSPVCRSPGRSSANASTMPAVTAAAPARNATWYPL